MNESRIIRDRADDFAAAADRAAGGYGALAAPRRLVQVYDGGNMPTAPDHVFLGRPVEIDGAETEGGAGTPSVDGSSSIPFVALWHAPSVGDLLVVTSVGGRWVAERAGAAQSTKVCVTACGSLPVFGAVVTVLSGSTAVATCTTGAAGCCTVPVSGTYTLQVSVSGSVVYSASRDLTGTVSVALGSNSGLVCCGGYAIPRVLTLTDAAGSLTFVYDPNYFYPLWTGGHSVQLQSCSVTTPNNVCVVADPSQGPVRVCYQMLCHAGSTPVFTVQRSWSWVYESGTFTPIWFQDPSGFTPGALCTTAPPGSCGSPLTDTASFGGNPASPAPFVLSGTPAPAGSNSTADPVGGSIAISA